MIQGDATLRCRCVWWRAKAQRAPLRSQKSCDGSRSGTRSDGLPSLHEDRRGLWIITPDADSAKPSGWLGGIRVRNLFSLAALAETHTLRMTEVKTHIIHRPPLRLCAPPTGEPDY